MDKKTIVLTGGGSAGHVTANIAIIPKLQELGWNIEYIGSEAGIEKQIIGEFGGIMYHPIQTGKLRRYFAIDNFIDPFRVIQGAYQAYALLRRIKPRIVFSKGGFVAVPVILGSWLNRIPLIIHESDITPGLANKISIPLATKVCVTFPETVQYITGEKAVYSGSPIREKVLQGNQHRGRDFCDFHELKPVLLIMGGSLGSQKINHAIRDNLDVLLARFQIVHLCGKGNVDPAYMHITNYKQYEYLHEELFDVFSIADLIVSRAGSNSIFEFLALKKPMVLIPLSKEASRGDQILNAQSFERLGYCRVLYEEDISPSNLYKAIAETYEQRHDYVAKMSLSPLQNSIDQIVTLIEKVAM